MVSVNDALAGLAVCVISLLVLGRSLGFVAADRGLVTHGPYAVVRHLVYASYLLIQSGYLLQSISLRNVLVMVLASGCNIGRALVEERLLTGSSEYGAYPRRVRWKAGPRPLVTASATAQPPAGWNGTSGAADTKPPISSN